MTRINRNVMFNEELMTQVIPAEAKTAATLYQSEHPLTDQVIPAEKETYKSFSLDLVVPPHASERHPNALIPRQSTIYLKLHEYSQALLTRAISDSSGQSDVLLDPDLHRRLAIATETMMEVRGIMNKGRGNVDGNNPQFPEAEIRTQLAYWLKNKINVGELIPETLTALAETIHAGNCAFHANALAYELVTVLAETTQAGNCDIHAAACQVYGSQKMKQQDAVAVVMGNGHTFAELRASPSPEEQKAFDIMMDSWADGEHAVLRQDSAMGNNKNSTFTLSAYEDIASRPPLVSELREKLARRGTKEMVEDTVRCMLSIPEKDRLHYEQWPLETTKIAAFSKATQEAMGKRNDYIIQNEKMEEHVDLAHRGFESGAMRAILADRLLRLET